MFQILDGKIKDNEWIKGLNNPLGMSIYNDHLYVAERNRVAQIDLDKGEVLERYDVPGSVFLNDLAIDEKGNIYISDSRKNVIWKIEDGESSAWLEGEEILDPNVLYIRDGDLLVGNSGDHHLKSIDLETKEISDIANLGPGFIDGIRTPIFSKYIEHNLEIAGIEVTMRAWILIAGGETITKIPEPGNNIATV